MINVQSVSAVAYNGATYYSTIEWALEGVSSGTVYVIPGTDPVVYKSCEVKSGVTLSIPYEGETTYGETTWANNHANDNPSAYRMNNISIATTDENNPTILTNSGSIVIGGLINGGSGSCYANGQTSGKYSQITLNAYSKIINTGTITTYGYIDETDSSTSITNSGVIYTPFVVTEHRGGSGFFGLYRTGSKSSAFNRFYLPNIRTKMITNYGASLYGMADLYANDKHNKKNVLMFGTSSSALIQMDAGTIIESKFMNSTQLDIYGNVALNPLSLSIDTGIPFFNNVTMSTADVLFPISWYYDIDLYKFKDGTNSTVNFGTQGVKLLPGSSMHIHEGVTVNASTIAVYNGTTDNVGGFNHEYEAKSQNANLTVDGTLNVSKIGGFVNTIGSTGKLVISSSSYVESPEIESTSSDGAKYKNFNFNLNLNVYSDSTSYQYSPNASIGTYYAKGGTWCKIGDVSIQYYSNYPSGTLDDYNVSTSTLTSNYDNGATIPSNIDSNIVPTIPDYYEFGGWYFDSSCSNGQQASNQKVYGDVTLYAKWIPIEYTVNVVINHNTGVTSSDTSYNIQNTYKVNEGIILIDIPVNKNNTFIGWYAKFENGTYSIDVDSLDDLLAYANGKTISIYGYFEGEPTITVDYNYSEILLNPANALVSENKVIKQSDWNDLKDDVTYYDGQLIESNTSLKKYFSHWEDQNGNRFDQHTQLTTSITIKAIWIEKAKITYYDSNNSVYKWLFIPKEGEYSSFTIEDSGVSKADLDKSSYFIRYTFDSWIIPNTLKANQDGTYTPISDSHIYPTFTSKEYIYVKLDISSATVSVNNTNYTSDGNIEFERGNNNITIKLVEYSGDSNKKFTINGTSVNEKSFENEMSHITVVASSSCLVEGTLITMADGTKKKVEDVVPGDMLLIFNHETGKYDIAPVLFNDSEEKSNYTVINLVFSDGTIIKVVSEHGFFDLDLMKYVYIDEINHRDFIGHQFYYSDIINNSIADGKVTLVDSYITTEYTRVYSPVTKYHLNYFTNNLLSMPGGIKGLFNIFEYDENLKYDEEKKQNDIETYGLYTYEDFKDLVSYEIYESFPANYFAVAIGKGLLTWDDIYYYIERYTPLM